jgi:1-phosphatidylinositol phosphodiesterase
MLRTTLLSSSFLVAGLFVLGAGITTVACGGDDSGGPTPPADSGTPGDAGRDGSAPHDASPSTDGSATDGGSDAADGSATQDSSTEDASDSGSNDSGAKDSGSNDSGSNDSGSGDAGDSGSNDSGSNDSGPNDSGSTDSGDAGIVDAGFTPASWMGALPGAKSLAGLSIPGTHDTGATIDVPGTTGTTRCQSLSVDDQLAIGVRYLDIRLKATANDHFEVFHTSVDQNLTFDQVLASISSLFAAHPGEAIVMSLKQEQGAASGVTNTFEQTFRTYVTAKPSLFYLGATVPTLDQARGKIVILRRFNATTLPTGIDVYSGGAWLDNQTFTLANGSATLRIQDYYQITDNPKKWKAITDLFTEATQPADAGDGGSGDVLYLNNTSAYFELDGGLEDIPSVSNAINPQLVTYFTSHTSGRYGIVGMDFVDANKASLILNTNFQ